MTEQERSQQEIELHLALVQAAAEKYGQRFRRWTVVLTLVLGFLGFFVTGSAFLGLVVGVMAFVVMWSGFSATRRRYQRQLRQIHKAIAEARRLDNERNRGRGVTPDLQWPGDGDRA